MVDRVAVSNRSSRPERLLFFAGAAAIGSMLASNTLGIITSTLAWEESILLILGWDLIVLGIVARTLRGAPHSARKEDLAPQLSEVIADSALLFALTTAAIVVLFGHSKSTERLNYFLAILVLVPLCVTLAWRRHRLVPTDRRRQVLACVTLAATAGILCLARLLLLSSTATLFLLLALVVIRAAIMTSHRFIATASTPQPPTQAATIATPPLLALIALPFIPTTALDFANILTGLTVGLTSFVLVMINRKRRAHRPVRKRLLDAGVLGISTLAVVYLGSPDYELATNQNYFLGPVSDVLHGHAMLVSTFSQYGVGMMDALAAAFLVIPIGYGTFTLLLSCLTAMLFAVMYVILRWSTRSLLLSTAGLTVSAILYVFGQIDSYAFFPSTGVLRFGLPWLVILCSLAAKKMERYKQVLKCCILVIVALAAAWSGEAGVYCLGTASAISCLGMAIADASPIERLRTTARQIIQLIVVSASGPLVLSLLTRLGSGTWPYWGGYLEFIRLYTVGGFGLLPIEPWSPGIALGAFYVLSAITTILLALMRPLFVREHVVTFLAITGLTTLGTLVYTYFLGRAAPNNLIHISPPAVALLFVWLGLARATFSSRALVATVTAVVAVFGTIIISAQRSNLRVKYSDTALAAVLDGPPRLGYALRTLWNNPVVDPSAPRIAAFVSSLRDQGTGLTILTTPNIATEALIRLGAANTVGSSNPCQEALSPRSPSRALAAVRDLRPGGIIIISPNSPVLPLQRYIYELMQARFIMEEIATGAEGLSAFRMIKTISPTKLPATPKLGQGIGCA